MLPRLLPKIPAEYESRFSRTLETVSLTYLIFASILLCASFLTETCSLANAGRVQLAIFSGSLCALTLGLSVLLITGTWHPRRSGVWCLSLAATAYSLILLGAMDPRYSASSHLAIAMIGLCFFLPFVRLCIVGALLFGATLIACLLRESGGSLLHTLSYSVPAFALSLFGFLGQQSGIRRFFLQQIENEKVTNELRLSKLALDNSSHYVVWLSRTGEIMYGNGAFCSTLGYMLSDLEGMRITSVSPDIDDDQWKKLSDELTDGGAAKRQLRLRTRNDVERLVEVQFDLVDSPSRQIICGLATDLTDRKRMDDDILRVQKLEGLGTLAGGLAHDYNNLLVPIVANASQVLDQLGDTHPARNAVLDVISAGERAASLTEQLIAYTSVSDVEPIPLSIRSELESVIKILRTTLPKGVKLTIGEEKRDVLVLGEAAQIHQVLFNLVLNAGQAVNERDGVITIEMGYRRLPAALGALLNPPITNPTGTYVTCQIRDNGHGMTSDVSSRMFDPFFTTKADGHGLGLSAVLGIMRNHKGGILVDSLPGHGTTITLFLPAFFGESVSKKGAVTKMPVEDGQNQLVLFVDDELLIRNVGQMILSTNGYRVLLAESGTEAIDKFERHAESVAVVVLDNRMPGPKITDTVEALRTLRPNVRIIASSGCPSEIPAELKNGPSRVAILPKPYQAQDLADAIGTAIAGSENA